MVVSKLIIQVIAIEIMNRKDELKQCFMCVNSTKSDDESVQKFASKVCLKQWSRNTRYQDMCNVRGMGTTQEGETDYQNIRID